MDKIGVVYLCGMNDKWKSGADGILSVLKWCMSEGLIASQYECPKCKRSMRLARTANVLDGYEWTCRTRKAPSHQVRRSVRCGSWFSESKLSIMKILMLTEAFVSNRSQKDIMNQYDVSAECVSNWRCYFRELLFEIVVRESGMIGGVNKFVEIDESKFGKRKYNRSKYVEGKWVFGGVERGSNKCFLRVVEKRDKDTLLDVIRTSILPGTTIISDCWKSYNILNDEEFKNLKVNHSLSFKNLETGGHTKTIQGTWSAVKRSLSQRTVTDQFDSYLAEYMWRKSHSGEDDLMRVFLDAVKKVHPPKTKDV